MNGNIDLITAIQLIKKDRSKEPQFFEALYQAKLLCPIQADTKKMRKNADGSVIVDDDTKVSVISISDSSGAKFLMAFSNWNELNKWNEGKHQQITVYTFNDYKNIMMNHDMPYRGVVINPFGDNIVLWKEVFNNSDPRFEIEPTNRSVMIGLPNEYPLKMVDKLKQYFHKTKLVDTAYLLWMTRGNEAGYLLVLGTNISPNELFPQMGEICKPYLDGKLLDIVPLDSSFGKNAVEGQQPIFCK